MTNSNENASFQTRVHDWLIACFGDVIASDAIERNHRFLEESLELVQACGCTKDEAHQLVDYVFNRPTGEKSQEVGGVLVTLSALCSAQGLHMELAGETELARVWNKVEQIRAKQASKPSFSPLPGSYPNRLPVESENEELKVGEKVSINLTVNGSSEPARWIYGAVSKVALDTFAFDDKKLFHKNGDNDWQRGIHPSLIPEGFALVESEVFSTLQNNVAVFRDEKNLAINRWSELTKQLKAAKKEVDQSIDRFAQDVIQMCRDYSSRNGNVYIKDVESTISILADRNKAAPKPEEC